MLYLAYALLTLHMFVGIFLIGLILLQRGRGGGLAGSFGGMGGQSAFGTKAGDIFTRITIVVAVIWILLACVCILVVGASQKSTRFKGGTDSVIKAPAQDKTEGAGNTAEDGKPAGDKSTTGDDKDGVLPSPGKAEQPANGEKPPEAADGKKDKEAAEIKNPAANESKPATANSDAPAEAKDNKEEPESSEPKKPE
jgi:preprotein translocase subunit SecG